MTEEDAKQKWRPMVNHYNALHEPCGNSFAMMGSPNDWRHTKCIGSSCMMWQHENVVTGAVSPTGGIVSGGYCGLAGKP
jgi:hypothetical protein